MTDTTIGPCQSEGLRVQALILAIMDLGDGANVHLTEDEAKQVLARVDVRDPLRPWGSTNNG